MKIEKMGRYESVSSWAIGLHLFSRRFGTLVLLLGSAWSFGFSKNKTAFGFAGVKTALKLILLSKQPAPEIGFCAFHAALHAFY